jgi:transcriptional regulator with XRE-family HTH domain
MTEKLRRLEKGGRPIDWPSLALLEFTVALARMMKANGDMKQKDLAERLGVSPPYISSVMSGNENLTVEQMSRLAEAAGGSLHLTIAPRGLYIRWVEDTLAAAPETMMISRVHSQETALSIPPSYPLSPPIEMLRRYRDPEQQSPIPMRRKLPAPRTLRDSLPGELRSPLGPNPLGQKEVVNG